MASILSNNNNNNNPQNSTSDNDITNKVENIITQIINSTNPQQTFNSVLQKSPEAKQAMDLINQYGNGNPKQAFLNYASQTGRQTLAQQILQKLGLS